MNSVCILGRMVRDPELRYSTGENSTAVCSFTLAVDRPRKDDEADFIRCIAFGKTGEVIGKHLTKGRQAAVTGRIQTGSYEKDGVRHYTTDVIVERFDFVGSKNDAPAPTKEPEQMRIPADAIPEGFETIPEDDVPF